MSNRDLLYNSTNSIAFLPSWSPFLYNGNYLRHYAELEIHGKAVELNLQRLAFTEKHIQGATMVDIGSCYGTFLRERNRQYPGSTFGWDVIPQVQRKLKASGLWWPIEQDKALYASMWDVIEHEHVPYRYLKNVSRGVFISTPIYEDLLKVEDSKHFKPGEHIWYFTEKGLLLFMERLEFALRDSNTLEQDFGRVDIRTYFFERV